MDKQSPLPSSTQRQLPSEPKRKLPTKVPDEIIVRYRPIVELEKWLLQRVQDRTKNKTLYVTVVAAIFAVFVVPIVMYSLAWMMFLLTQAGTVAGTVGGAAEAANKMLLMSAFLLTSGLATVGAVAYNALPTHLALSKKGLRLLWRHRLYKREGDTVSWEKISRLGLELPKGKTSPLDHVLRFDFGTNKALRLRLGCIPTAEERARLLEAVEIYSPDLNRDAGAVQALELPPDYSYTELWLQALSGPPKRERLTPIEHHAGLRDDRYLVDRALGVGGQGTAYLAYDRELGESVVLKEFILPVFVDVNVRRQSLERFEKEARILRQLQHEQVVRLIDFFVEDHRGYLVLEHIDGQSLRELVLSSGPLPEKDVHGLALQMCKILNYLHALTPPVVHRDFTPDNLILRKDGTLKLVDFNVAQQKETTSTGTVVGKHAYLPPEQFRGQPTTQSDIYSMGASLFFILTGEDPEPISQQHPRKVKAEISEALDRAVARATAIELSERYSSAEDMERELQGAGVI